SQPARALRCIKAPAAARSYARPEDRSRSLTEMPSLITSEQGPGALLARGAWTVANVELLERLCAAVPSRPRGPIDLSGVTALDTVGAWLFEKLARREGAGSSEAVFVGASPSYTGLLREVRELNRRGPGGARRENPLADRLVKYLREL